MSTALIIDDNRQTADALHQMLDVLGVEARVAYGSSPAMSILQTLTPRLILSGYQYARAWMGWRSCRSCAGNRGLLPFRWL